MTPQTDPTAAESRTPRTPGAPPASKKPSAPKGAAKKAAAKKASDEESLREESLHDGEGEEGRHEEGPRGHPHAVPRLAPRTGVPPGPGVVRQWRGPRER